MRRLVVAVSTPPHVRTDWSVPLQQAGYDILPCHLHEVCPVQLPDVWVVALDARQQPVRLSLWLGQLSVPLVLITPHLAPAELLCGRVPFLRLICHPLGALDGIGDLVKMAHEVQSGTLVLPHDRPLSTFTGSASR